MGLNDVNVDQMVSEVSARHGQSTESSNSDSTPANTQASATPEGKTAEEILNLDGTLKFKFGNREWTPDSLKKAIMFQSDYTKKTQELSETRKYYDNLEYDLDAVRKNPQLADAFLKTYPKQFHKFLNLVGGSDQAASLQTQNRDTQAPIPPELMDRFLRVESYVKETEVKAAEADLDAKFSTLSKKYPEAIEDVVLARAQALLDKGDTPTITVEMWDKLWKQSHEETIKRFEAKQKETLNKQRTANQSYKGPSSGGGVPTGAPKRETMSQATDRAIRELQGRKF